MNEIHYGSEEVEDMTHYKPTLVYMPSESKCIYWRESGCLMKRKCRFEKFKDNKKICSVEGKSNLGLRVY